MHFRSRLCAEPWPILIVNDRKLRVWFWITDETRRWDRQGRGSIPPAVTCRTRFWTQVSLAKPICTPHRYTTWTQENTLEVSCIFLVIMFLSWQNIENIKPTKQFCGIKDSHTVAQPLPLSISRTFSSSITETLYGLNTDSPTLPLLATRNHPSTLFLWT